MTDDTKTYEIAEYRAVDAMLAQIKARYDGRVYDVTTKEGMADAKFARREIRTTRTGLEKLRKELKEPALRRCQLIDSEAKRITAALIAIEGPIDDTILAEENRVEREKQERARAEALRVAGIKERIEAFNVMPAWGAKADDIMARLREVDAMLVTTDIFQEFTEAAAIAKGQAFTRLTTMHADAKAIEDEQERLRVLQAETEARLKAEREAHEKAMEAERQERIAAQKKLDEAAAEERARLAEEAKKARAAQLEAQEQAEREARDKALSEAKCSSYAQALARVGNVVAAWLSDQIDAEAAMDEIEVIVTANA